MTKPWTDAMFGFKLALQTEHRSESTITNRMCSTRIMVKHAIAAGLDGPADVDYPWLARYLSEQYASRQRSRPANLYADLRCFWHRYSGEFGTGRKPPPATGWPKPQTSAAALRGALPKPRHEGPPDDAALVHLSRLV